MTGRLPPSASVARAGKGAKLYAPAAERNADALCNLLALHAPRSGQALEIASGTGQHIVAFARTLPQLIWQPTEIDAARRASIDAYAAEAGLPNLHSAKHLDATVSGWAETYKPLDLIVLINLLHLISESGAETLIREAMAALSPRGQAVFYGPFKRNGALTSNGDARFDAELRGADPAIGYKDDTQILEWLETAGAADVTPVSMPANNLAFLATKGPG
jgi:cyclopropane fatty-acyl-phospholipid synthase-like methyltransferase